MSSWMITNTGREHWLSGSLLLTNEVAIEEIAHALALINRFTGHTKRPYSVAEHSLFVCDLVEKAGHGPAVQLAALMHDAHEAFTGDQSSPAKNAIGLSWGTFEALQADIIRRRFNLVTTFAVFGEAIQRADLVALATERRDLTAYQPGRNKPWFILDAPDRRIEPDAQDLDSELRSVYTWRDWEHMFRGRFAELSQQVAADASRLTAATTHHHPV